MLFDKKDYGDIMSGYGIHPNIWRNHCERAHCPYQTGLYSGAADYRDAVVFLELVANRIPTMTGLAVNAMRESDRMDGGILALISLAIDWGRHRQRNAESVGEPATDLPVELAPNRTRWAMMEIANEDREGE